MGKIREEWVCSRCGCNTPDRITAVITAQAKYCKLSPIDNDPYLPNIFALCPRCYIAFSLFLSNTRFADEDDMVKAIADQVLGSND